MSSALQLCIVRTENRVPKSLNSTFPSLSCLPSVPPPPHNQVQARCFENGHFKHKQLCSSPSLVTLRQRSWKIQQARGGRVIKQFLLLSPSSSHFRFPPNNPPSIYPPHSLWQTVRQNRSQQDTTVVKLHFASAKPRYIFFPLQQEIFLGSNRFFSI